MNREDKLELRILRSKGLTYKQLAIKFNCTEKIVYQTLMKEDILTKAINGTLKDD